MLGDTFSRARVDVLGFAEARVPGKYVDAVQRATGDCAGSELVFLTCLIFRGD